MSSPAVEQLLREAAGHRHGGRIADAEAALRRATALDPSDPVAHYELSVFLHAHGQFAPAAESMRRAITLRPDMADLYYNYAVILRDLDRSDEAIAAASKSISLNPQSADVYVVLGHALRDVGRHDESRQAYERALRVDPNYAKAHYALSLELLREGRYPQGWAEHEWRWLKGDYTTPRREFGVPQWDGTKAEGKVLLIHREQGLGDAIQFARFVPLAAKRAGRVMAECHPAMARLMRGVQGVDEVVAAGEALPPCDLHIPMMSLPHVLGTTIETIPAAVPCFAIEAKARAKWAQRVAQLPKGLKVGLAWAGNPKHGSDRKRSIPLEMFEGLLRLEGISRVSLQKYVTLSPAASSVMTDWTAELSDLAETAALIANLDLIVSVDTAVAHLAGALGKPVFTLIAVDSDWRWMLDRTDSPWYPTMRLFRQQRVGEWKPVIEAVTRAVEEIRDSAGST